MARRKPIIFQRTHHSGEELPRTLGTFQLMMLGVGATVGTGVFFVLSEAVPVAGPSVLISFLLAAVAAGLSALCYAELSSSIPVSGSTYSFSYHALGEGVAVLVGGCVLLEYGVAVSAVAVGWKKEASLDWPSGPTEASSSGMVSSPSKPPVCRPSSAAAAARRCEWAAHSS